MALISFSCRLTRSLSLSDSPNCAVCVCVGQRKWMFNFFTRSFTLSFVHRARNVAEKPINNILFLRFIWMRGVVCLRVFVCMSECIIVVYFWLSCTATKLTGKFRCQIWRRWDDEIEDVESKLSKSHVRCGKPSKLHNELDKQCHKKNNTHSYSFLVLLFLCTRIQSAIQLN